MSTRHLFSIALVGTVAACAGNVSLGDTGGGNLSTSDAGSRPDGGGSADAATIDCSEPDACGPAPGMPSWICADGSTAGSTGRCIQQGSACGWEILECPDAGAPACFDNNGALLPKYKTCTVKADCVVATFVQNCCGTMLSAGVNAASKAEVLTCAEARAATFPGCGCASQGTIADDNSTDYQDGTPGGTPSVDCKAGKCQTTFNVTCGTNTCAPDQQCCVGMPFSTPTCVTGSTCPISQRQYKTDIRYLPETELQRLNEELMSFRLATYRYKTESSDAKSHLGFMIDDVGPSAAVHGDGQHVDLYGYATMTVAALQTQAREIAELKRELRELKAARTKRSAK